MFNALLESRKSEIQDKPSREVQHSQICAALRGKNRMLRTDSLQFDNNPIVDKQINPFRMFISLAEYMAFIHDWAGHLSLHNVTTTR